MPLLLPDEPPAPDLPGVTFEPEDARSILRPQKDERYGFGFALSPYRGCSHACRYCYVREYPDLTHSADTWGQWVAPKLNAPELLWTSRHRLHGQSVFLASATDPYQPAERHYQLTYKCLEVLLSCPTTRVLIHTRSSLVLRDLDLLRAFGPRLSVGISIPTDDDTVRQLVEPRAPAIPTRWATVEKLTRAGIQVHVSATPLLPISDPHAFGRRARDSGATRIWVGRLRLLRQDPMKELLEAQGWEHILQEDYATQIREIVTAYLPGPRRQPRKPRILIPPPTRTRFVPGPRQPSLFD